MKCFKEKEQLCAVYEKGGSLMIATSNEKQTNTTNIGKEVITNFYGLIYDIPKNAFRLETMEGLRSIIEMGCFIAELSENDAEPWEEKVDTIEKAMEVFENFDYKIIQVSEYNFELFNEIVTENDDLESGNRLSFSLEEKFYQLAKEYDGKSFVYSNVQEQNENELRKDKLPTTNEPTTFLFVPFNDVDEYNSEEHMLEFGWIEVKESWALEQIKKIGYHSIPSFKASYTVEDTEGWIFIAERENALIDFGTELDAVK